MEMTKENKTQEEIIKQLAVMKAQGDEFDAFDLVRQMGFTDGDTKIRDWLIKNSDLRRSDWTLAVKFNRVEKELGQVPKTSLELVELWVKKQGVEVNFNQTLVKKVAPTVDGQALSDSDINTSYGRLVDDVAGTQILNVAEMMRELRLFSSDYHLAFNKDQVTDAVDKWFSDKLKARKLEIAMSIHNEKINKSRADKEWMKFVKSCFSENNVSYEFVIAVLQKFIWQVKLKIRNKDNQVTHHLMPVITGSQGKGKSTMVRKFLEPIYELFVQTDFKMVTDERVIDIWNYSVLFLDEMGFADKAEIDIVKGVISAPTVARRPMHTNKVVTIPQKATFIGCTNKELGQLIRDETGLRRFVDIEFSNNPDHETLNTIDWLGLWQSVDELASDPILPFMDSLRERQETQRQLSVVEQWVTSLQEGNAGETTKYHSDWFDDFKVWRDQYAASNKMDLAGWQNEMRRLVKQNVEFPFSEAKRGSKGNRYKYSAQ